RNNYEILNKIVFIGAIARDKGQIDAIEALKLLAERGLFYELYFVGQVTDKQYYDEILSAIDNSIRHNIHFCGYTPDVSEYRKPEYLVLVCSPAEAFGLVTVEAMEASQIVIGVDGGATAEIIKDGESGFLYKAGNPEDLFKK